LGKESYDAIEIWGWVGGIGDVKGKWRTIMPTNKNITTVYAWKIKEGLCNHAEPFPWYLNHNKKPSPEAKVVKCILMSYSEYIKLRRK